MDWLKNGILLTGGVVLGMILLDWVNGDGAGGSVRDYDDERSERNEKPDGMKILIEKIRADAEDAIKECGSDAEREAVYAQIRESVENFRDELQTKGEEIIADLREKSEELREEKTDRVQNIKETLAKASESLNEMLDSIKPEAEFAV